MKTKKYFGRALIFKKTQNFNFSQKKNPKSSMIQPIIAVLYFLLVFFIDTLQHYFL